MGFNHDTITVFRSKALGVSLMEFGGPGSIKIEIDISIQIIRLFPIYLIIRLFIW